MEQISWKKKATFDEKNAQLLKIVKLCQDWLNNTWERARHHGANKPAVDTLQQQAWKRLAWESYIASKQEGSKSNLKDLQGNHAFEAAVMNKQEYKKAHVGINSVKDILAGFSADTSANTALNSAQKNAVDNFVKQNKIPKSIDKMSIQQYTAIESFIITNNIDSQFRQQYYSVDERISRMLIPDKNGGIWLYKPDVPFDTHAAGLFTRGQALYVVDKYGNWYVDEAKPGVINHSSICRGQPILCGGMLEAKQGKLTTIINNSGHYCPNRRQFAEALRTVEKLFGNWETIEVTVTRGKGDDVTFGGTNPQGRVSPTKFMKNPDHAGNGGRNFAGWP